MKKWLISLAAAVLLAGCASSNTAGLRIDGASQTVIFGDNVLAGQISIEDISTVDVDGRARGVVRLLNQSKGDQYIQYRFYWYDDQGLEVNNKLSPWRQSILRGGEEVSISEISINPNGRQFRVQIRQLDN
ncbi:YcfL protein: an outer membrane lipoprotein that is part of a salvage cluster [Vibrio galatheae]|uniref:YcfL protein: an outer membrane lipoprotein that is part of a salvage cluster n=1 Tax=Vibrio galatheae TaxID=579748 RepID=A0A0F4NKA8_9VIBR|nr:YcfL family protein [Vibrio galatheae]KJY83527.1 YcfL protein: an outer membrane lipoprotein that is part of a salvage cluster [Vibrio galatheae]